MINSKTVDRLVGSGKLPPAVGTIITDHLSEPLMMLPSMIATTVRGYLLDAKLTSGESIDDSYASVPMTYYREINTAVLYINGAMSNKTQRVPCAKTPASYERIRTQIDRARADGMTKLVGVFQTGGGSASGMFALSRYIKSLDEEMSLTAVIDDYAYSAGMGLASAFTRIFATETSGGGSIGVVLAHQHEKKSKIATEFITFGEKKVDGNSTEPLSESARADLQKEVDRLGMMFVDLIHDNMGLSKKEIIDLQAGTIHGEELIEKGLATDMGTLDDVINLIYEGEI